ncbi:hypothetical protein ES702_06162 [subsurface metagenome]
MKSKSLKLSSIVRVRKEKMTSRHNVSFPKFNIHGKWLRDIGFEIGDVARIRYSEGVIIITKEGV